MKNKTRWLQCVSDKTHLKIESTRYNVLANMQLKYVPHTKQSPECVSAELPSTIYVWVFSEA